MKKYHFLMVALLFGLAGCGQAGTAEPAADQSSESQEITEVQMPSEDHLPHSGILEHYNEHDFFNGFAVSEVEKDGQLCYCFTREDGDVRLVMDVGKRAVEKNAELTIGGQSTVFTATFMPAGGSTGIYWTDLTGDGAPEFIYMECWSGTGFHPNTCHIFDGVTLERLSWTDFAACIEAEFSTIADVELCGTEVYIDENNILMARGVVMEKTEQTGRYFGEAQRPMSWDPAQERFVFSGPMIVELYEEAEA